MENITNNQGLIHIFCKIIGYTGYSGFAPSGEYLGTNRNLKLVNENWKALSEDQELLELAKISKNVKLFCTFQKLLANAVKLCREDMVKLLYKEFPQFWPKLSTDFIFDITKAILRCTRMKYPTIKIKLMSILAFFISTDKDCTFITIDVGTDHTHVLPCPYGQEHFIPSNSLAYALLEDRKSFQNIDLINLFIKPLEMVKYPEEISFENLAAINEYAALRGCVEILNIIARKLWDEYVDLAYEILEKKSTSDYIDDDVVNFMRARIRGDEIPNLSFLMDYDFMNTNVLEHNQDEDEDMY